MKTAAKNFVLYSFFWGKGRPPLELEKEKSWVASHCVVFCRGCFLYNFELFAVNFTTPPLKCARILFFFSWSIIYIEKCMEIGFSDVLRKKKAEYEDRLIYSVLCLSLK